MSANSRKAGRHNRVDGEYLAGLESNREPVIRPAYFKELPCIPKKASRSPSQIIITTAAPRVDWRRWRRRGGLGSPSLRDREAVLADVAEGRVSPQGAARDYGIEVG